VTLFRATALLHALSLALAGCAASAGEPRCGLAITDVTLIDVDAGRPLPGRTVVVCGRHIERVAADTAGIDRDARRIDGRGLYLLPGLWDAHTHALTEDFAEWFAPLALANGVTSVRDMGFFPDSGIAARRAVTQGAIAGPRLLLSMRLDGPSNRAPWVTRAATHAEGVAAVREARRLGMDFVKVYSNLPRDAFLGALEEARRIGMPVDGHVPYAVGMREAIAAGQRTIEHEDDLMRECTVGGDSLRAALAAPRTDRRPDAELLAVRALGRAMRERPDARRCAEAIRALSDARVAVTPTLVVYQPYAHARTPAIMHPERDRYVPAALARAWRERVSRVTDADTTVAAAFFSYPRTLTMQRAGVPLLAGTDTPLPWLVPGFSLHDELEQLVRAGLTAPEALRAATVTPAAVLGLSDSLGAIAPGQLADLLLVARNPLEDVAHLREIRAVVADGRLYDRAALDAMLRRAARFAGH
jgi:imidazolonepropionase-like amidohydrolase